MIQAIEKESNQDDVNFLIFSNKLNKSWKTLILNFKVLRLK